MKRLAAALIALSQLLIAAPAATHPGASAIVNVTIVPMDRERTEPGQTIVIRDGRIESISPTASTILPADLPQIDGTGRYLMPGLAEMHAHVPPNPQEVQWTRDVLFLYVANGVTFARSMLGAPHHFELRDRAERRELLSPRLLLSGPSFNGNSVPSPETGRRMVAEQKRAGYDFLKIHPGLDWPRYEAIAQAAREASIPFGGHVPDAVGILRAFEARQRTVDHLDGMLALLLADPAGATEPGFFGYNLATRVDEGRIAEAVRRTRESGTWQVPTESLIHHVMLPDPENRLAARDEFRFVPKAMRESWMASRARLQSNPQWNSEQAHRFVDLRSMLIKALSDGGAGLLLGADSPQWFNVPGFAIHHELRILVEAGLTPFEALATGTRNVGRFLGDEHHGLVAEGARADLLLVEANPLADVANVRRRAGVVLGGRWIAESEIQAGLESLARRFAD